MNDIPILDPDTLSHAPVGDLLDLLIEHEDRVPRILFDACVTREQPKPGRNDPCPCGSGIKYKSAACPPTRRAKHLPASRIERITI